MAPLPCLAGSANPVAPPRTPPLQRIGFHANSTKTRPITLRCVTVPACRNASAPAWSKCCAAVPSMPFLRPVYNYKITNWANGDCSVFATGTTSQGSDRQTGCTAGYSARSSHPPSTCQATDLPRFPASGGHRHLFFVKSNYILAPAALTWAEINCACPPLPNPSPLRPHRQQSSAILAWHPVGKSFLGSALNFIFQSTDVAQIGSRRLGMPRAVMDKTEWGRGSDQPLLAIQPTSVIATAPPSPAALLRA
ncbi:hypothetical protein BGZ61DRAFT_517197 [Ilyonectria robusta]|uniref:uncharacterized protein n=1 Tax=Ilyonectria robusta TaxID=1079257 RepID=UPI001E8D2343|nr:uncharacterized protein BGZ61DRAFT_517197 [Ilyonectria robusta]KAH8706567.1 hypothetical protein BGZ61DRAFT_517197 [Ilyonectria robusta]